MSGIGRFLEFSVRTADIIESLVQDHGLLIVGAEYSLESGIVEFFDGLPGD